MLGRNEDAIPDSVVELDQPVEYVTIDTVVGLLSIVEDGKLGLEVGGRSVNDGRGGFPSLLVGVST